MTKLTVEKKNVAQLLDIGNKKYIIPDYQRPYAWDTESCDILWDDIKSFYEEHKKDQEEYYLGTLVTCKGRKKSHIEIIDGQQRITSFLLLLRAFYAKLEEMYDTPVKDPAVDGLMRHIEPCIWEVDSMTRRAPGKQNTRNKNPNKRISHIESKVATVNDNVIFHKLLINGKREEGKSQYLVNYQNFREKCDKYAKEFPMRWKELCLFILERCILLPIECENSDAALDIFSTLNDRGIPLSDSDIFKSRIYQNQLNDKNRKKFVERWKELGESVERWDELEANKKSDISIETPFRYYYHYLRGTEGITAKEIGLRVFYSQGRYKRLKADGLVDNLIELSEFWNDILSTDNSKYLSTQGKQYVHCLLRYPNEYWRYVVSVFFLANKGMKLDKFSNELTKLLIKMTAFFYAKFIIYPSVNAIKDDVFRMYRDLCDPKKGVISPLSVRTEGERLQGYMKIWISPKIERGLLLLHAYLQKGQNDLIPRDFQIEHIFPVKWQNTNYNGWSRKDADEYLQNIGNKIAIEKKCNIYAGNNYFAFKKQEYAKSKITEMKALSRYKNSDWVKMDIEDRQRKVINTLVSFFSANVEIKE